MKMNKKTALVVSALALAASATGVYAYSAAASDSAGTTAAAGKGAVEKKDTGFTTEIFDCNGKDLEGLFQVHIGNNFTSPFESTLCLDAAGRIADLNTAGPAGAKTLFINDQISSVKNDTGRPMCVYTDSGFRGDELRINDQEQYQFAFMDPEFRKFNDSISSIRAC
ncbi:peptidase inhibitor family I36 protein [Streptomyces sp. NPDC047097]|uniref:peptidase inhibitor family I36 protein n=1 Tax=Streptomyces sp. NPDC047097 TaxID=3155260 RepID=UPI0033BFD47F